VNRPTSKDNLNPYAGVYILIFFFALIYGTFSLANIFENQATKIVISIIASILFGILIDPKEIAQAVLLYKSLYITIILFLPILILGAITFKAIEKFDAFGIFIQKTLWGIYGFYLLFASMGLLLFSNNFLKGLNEIFPFNYLWTYLFKYIWMFYDFFGLMKEDTAMGIFLLILAILIIYTLVLNNEGTTKIIRDQITSAKKIKEKDKAIKFNAIKNMAVKSVDNA